MIRAIQDELAEEVTEQYSGDDWRARTWN